MECRTCGNQAAYAVRTVYDDQRIEEWCDRCGFSGSGGVPDVYFKGPYFDRNLSDQNHPGGQLVTSRSHKALLLKQYGLREAGDRQHGSNGFDPIAARHSRESLRRNHGS